MLKLQISDSQASIDIH